MYICFYTYRQNQLYTYFKIICYRVLSLNLWQTHKNPVKEGGKRKFFGAIEKERIGFGGLSYCMYVYYIYGFWIRIQLVN